MEKLRDIEGGNQKREKRGMYLRLYKRSGGRQNVMLAKTEFR